HEFDTDTGFSYQDARYYSSSIGRFASEDPHFLVLGFSISDPQSMNAYAYARNNPLIFIDPSGNAFTLASVWHNVGGYAYGFGEGAINTVSGAIGYAAELGAHPISTINSTLNSAASVTGRLAYVFVNR